MIEIVKISQNIRQKINDLELARGLLKKRGKEKAETIANYEKEIAKTLIGLKNGKEFEIDGEKIVNPPASIMDKLARGICYQVKLDSEVAESSYKSAIVGIQAISSELNGLQSVFRYLEHETEV